MKKIALFAGSLALLLLTGGIGGAMGTGLALLVGIALPKALVAGGLIAAVTLCTTTMRMERNNAPTHLTAAAVTAAGLYAATAFGYKLYLKKAAVPEKKISYDFKDAREGKIARNQTYSTTRSAPDVHL